MPRNKVVLIGAGSVVFTRELIADFIVDGKEWEVRLVDINKENLEVAHGLADRMIKMKSAPIELKMSTERSEMLPGADTVITVIDVGGRQAWKKDIQIPRKYGIYMPVADTTTPGGFARSLRIIPVMISIAQDIKRYCPNALFLNYCNPMAALVRAINREERVPVYGLCHGVPHVVKYFANFLNVDVNDCEWLAVGFNHFDWFLKFRVHGGDAYLQIKQKNEELRKAGKPLGNDPDQKLCWELLDLFNCFPLSRDRHITEFFPQFYIHGKHYGKTLGVERFPLEAFIIHGNEEFEEMKRIAQNEVSVPKTMFHERVGEFGVAVGILQALEQETPKCFYTTIPNNNRVTNLDEKFCIEGPVDFSHSGIVPIEIGTIPTGIKACIDKAFVTTELIIDAALERSRKKFVQAIVIDGCVSSIKQANQLAEELIEVHKEYLPGW